MSPSRAFSATSYWNTPSTGPVHPNSDAMIAHEQTAATTNYVSLGGTFGSDWGSTVYLTKSTDTAYNVVSDLYSLPPEFASLRIPAGAVPTVTSDHQMTIYDGTKGVLAQLWQARLVGSVWHASGGGVWYLASNGLDGDVEGSDEPRNRGYRGCPYRVVRWADVAAGVIPYVMRVSVPSTSVNHVWPMDDSDGDSTDPNAPPQGSRIRLKASVNLDDFTLTPEARIVATALQTYGACVCDSSGGPVSVPFENVDANPNDSRSWSGKLTPSSLSALPLDLYEFAE